MFSSKNNLCCIRQLLLLLTEGLRSVRSQVSGDALGGKSTVRLACLVEHHRLLLPSSKVHTKQPSLRLAETALRQRTYPFSSDQGSQASSGLGSTRTRLSDRPGTLSAATFCPRVPVTSASRNGTSQRDCFEREHALRRMQTVIYSLLRR